MGIGFKLGRSIRKSIGIAGRATGYSRPKGVKRTSMSYMLGAGLRNALHPTKAKPVKVGKATRKPRIAKAPGKRTTKGVRTTKRRATMPKPVKTIKPSSAYGPRRF